MESYDTEYVARRNQLIPIAEVYAERKIKELGRATWTIVDRFGIKQPFSYFTKFFHEEMNRLAREKGLTTF